MRTFASTRDALQWLASGRRGGRRRGQAPEMHVQSTPADGFPDRKALYEILAQHSHDYAQRQRILRWAAPRSEDEVDGDRLADEAVPLTPDDRVVLAKIGASLRECGRIPEPTRAAPTERVTYVELTDGTLHVSTRHR